MGHSGIDGDGLFARALIPAGTLVSRLGGRIVSGQELRGLLARRDRPYVNSITVGADAHLVLPPDCVNGCGNHSCDPNLWWVGAYALAARREIAAGDELTNDYATSTASATFRMPCRCGSPICRGVITGDDWRRPELQARYAGHWVPALAELIARRATR